MAAATARTAPAHRGRFAPSPTGLLHAGSVVAALASWLDGRAHGGTWCVRIEDTDTPRCSPQAAEGILDQLDRLGLRSDEPVVWQSRRGARYEHALDALARSQRLYRCRCSRRDIAQALGTTPDAAERAYPGTCRLRAWPIDGPGALRFRLDPPTTVHWMDRRLGPQVQDVAHAVGDFILRRRDGLWAYQLAVVVDDADQGVTDVVRGEDLADNTARQILLQRALGLPTPRYLHTPLVLAADGRKLSKQNAAIPVDLSSPAAVLQALTAAGRVLGLPEALVGHTRHAGSAADWLAEAVRAWPWRPGAAPAASGASASIPRSFDLPFLPPAGESTP